MRYTIETAKDLFLNNGCELLEDEYVNSSIPMCYRCECKSISTIALSELKRGRRCRSCGNKKAGKTRQNQAVDQKELVQYFQDQGCKLLSEYTSYNDHLKYVCSCGQEGSTTWWSFQKGRRCGRCADVRKRKYDVEEVAAIFKKEGCELLQSIYERNDIPLEYRCSCGNVSKIRLMNFLSGNRCFDCGIKKMTGENNHRWIKDRDKKTSHDCFRKKCGGMVRRCLSAIGEEKLERTHQLLGYSPKELQEHIKKHPNWDKVKDGSWHLDHVYPINAFLEHNISDLSLINHLDNLQPITQKENNEKHAKYDKRKFKRWLKKVSYNKALFCISFVGIFSMI